MWTYTSPKCTVIAFLRTMCICKVQVNLNTECFRISVYAVIYKFFLFTISIGDGRMDSPGHCAQYCTYTVMEEATKQILSCITIDKRHCADKSTGLEKLGFIRSLDSLKEKRIRIKEVVTDAHVQISSIMSEFII